MGYCVLFKVDCLLLIIIHCLKHHRWIDKECRLLHNNVKSWQSAKSQRESGLTAIGILLIIILHGAAVAVWRKLRQNRTTEQSDKDTHLQFAI